MPPLRNAPAASRPSLPAVSAPGGAQERDGGRAPPTPPGVGRARWRGGFRAAMHMETVDLVPRLTLLVWLFNPVGEGGTRALGLLLAGLGVVFPALARGPRLWCGLALLAGGRVVMDWPLADNHAYLLGYWCLALCLSLRGREPGAALAFHGRMLIGLAFACATLWKAVLSPDYLDGTFFRVMLLVDERFEAPVRLVSGLRPDQLAANRRLLAEEGVPDSVSPEAQILVEPARLTLLAQAATWGTVCLEAAVALTFLWPGRGWITRQRHLVLAVFCVTIYAIAPVVGFGWLLLVMGVAQCEPERTAVRTVYLALFFGLLLYQALPWMALLAD